MRRNRMNAFMTVEMSVIVPVVLFIFMGLILSIFYFHDKNVLSGSAYEAAVVGSLKIRGNEEFSEEELVDFCMERIKGKCILFGNCNVEASIQKKEIVVRILAEKGSFSVSVEKKAAVTEPENRIREIRRVDLNYGEKNND